jgi:hypothetical protein
MREGARRRRAFSFAVVVGGGWLARLLTSSLVIPAEAGIQGFHGEAGNENEK